MRYLDSRPQLTLSRRITGEIRLSLRHRRSTSPTSQADTDGYAANIRMQQLGARHGRALVCSVVTQDSLVPDLRGASVVRMKRRRNHIGNKSRRNIREFTTAIDCLYGRSSLFLTGTLPGSTDEAITTFARLSSEIQTRVTQYIRDHAPHSKYVFVWELQKRGALHCHIAVGVFNKRTKREIKRTFHRYWCRLLKRLSFREGVDLFGRREGGSWASQPRMVRAIAQDVRQSVARYLAKYLSKGGDSNTDLTGLAPSRWYSASLSLKQEVIRRTRKLLIRGLTNEQYEYARESIPSFLLRRCHRMWCHSPPENYGLSLVVAYRGNEDNPMDWHWLMRAMPFLIPNFYQQTKVCLR